MLALAPFFCILFLGDREAHFRGPPWGRRRPSGGGMAYVRHVRIPHHFKVRGGGPLLGDVAAEIHDTISFTHFQLLGEWRLKICSGIGL